MANSAENVIVQQKTTLYVAPLGTELPASISAELNSAFKELGFLDPDGVTLNTTTEKTDIEALQSTAPIKSIVTKREGTLALGAMEFTAQNLALAFPGKTTGSAKAYVFKIDETLDMNRAWVLEVVEGEKKLRWIFPKAGQTGDSEIAITKEDAITIPLELTVQNDGVNGLFMFQTNINNFNG